MVGIETRFLFFGLYSFIYNRLANAKLRQRNGLICWCQRVQYFQQTPSFSSYPPIHKWQRGVAILMFVLVVYGDAWYCFLVFHETCPAHPSDRNIQTHRVSHLHQALVGWTDLNNVEPIHVHLYYWSSVFSEWPTMNLSTYRPGSVTSNCTTSWGHCTVESYTTDMDYRTFSKNEVGFQSRIFRMKF